MRLLPLVLLAACAASRDVTVAHSPDTDFSTWKTYRWRATTVGGDPSADEAWVEEQIVTNVDKQLAAKGFVKGSPPDFIVTYAAVAGTGTTAYVEKYRIGTVILKMIDPEIDKTVWRATSSDEIEEGARKRKRERRAEALIQKMLKDFPPKPATSG